MDCLQVIDITKGHENSHPESRFPDVLPKHEFTLLLVAPPGSGKTNLICNLILRQYKGYFHKIVVCSPSYENDEKWEEVMTCKHVLVENKKLKELGLGTNYSTKETVDTLVLHPDPQRDESVLNGEELTTLKESKFDGIIPAEDFFTDLDLVVGRMQVQDDLIKDLKKLVGKKAKMTADRMLLILDDQAGMFKACSTNNPFANFIFRHRHYSCSVIVVTQDYHAMTAGIRKATMCAIFFDITNEKELKGIYEEHPCGLKYDQWIKVFKYCTRDEYAFMFINKYKPRGKRIFKNFLELITVADERNASPSKKRKRDAKEPTADDPESASVLAPPTA
jgi:GTPase SAR1 family protein